jgi:phage terminase large subunit-like protein
MLCLIYLPPVWSGHLTRTGLKKLLTRLQVSPQGGHDDYVDSVSLAMMRFRKGGFIRLPSDEEESEAMYRRRGGFY